MFPRWAVGLFLVPLSGCLIMFAWFTWPAQAYQDDDRNELLRKIEAAKVNGVKYVQLLQGRNGEWEGDFIVDPRKNPKQAGATALCALALMENGVPAQNKNIQAAAEVVRQTMHDPAFNYNYSICLSLLFLHRLHGEKNVKHPDAAMIRALTQKIIAGQLDDGGWGYMYPWHGSDNSNTQFAVIALWIARSYDVPGVDKALARTAARFRNSQKESGGWGYDAGGPSSRGFPLGSMTCAALLGIALDAGLKREALQAKFKGEGAGGELEPIVTNLMRDKQVVAARTYLASVLRTIPTDKFEERHPAYFLWSLERVSTLYGWAKIDRIDWYAMGARHLVKTQKPDGSWNLDQAYPMHIDTAFALLFLAKTNLLGRLEDAVFTEGPLNSGGLKPLSKPKSEMTKEEIAQRAQELFKHLPTSLPTDRVALLEEIEKLPGNENTIRLAQIIPKLTSPGAQKQTRETLQRRLQRLPVKTLAEYLHTQDNREVRLAAARAALVVNDQEIIPDLIPLLEDADKEISDSAHEALKSISHVTLGKSLQAWSRWYEMTKKK